MQLLTTSMRTSLELKAGVAAGGAIGAYLFGAEYASLMILLLFMAFDYITGVWAGYVNQELSSAVGFRGIVRKVLMLVPIAMAVQLDRLGGLDPPILTLIVLWGLVANEGLSILENLAAAGVPVPERLRAALAGLREKSEETERVR